MTKTTQNEIMDIKNILPQNVVDPNGQSVLQNTEYS